MYLAMHFPTYKESVSGWLCLSHTTEIYIAFTYYTNTTNFSVFVISPIALFGWSSVPFKLGSSTRGLGAWWPCAVSWLSKDCALLDRDLRYCSWDLLELLSQLMVDNLWLSYHHGHHWCLYVPHPFQLFFQPLVSFVFPFPDVTITWDVDIYHYCLILMFPQTPRFSVDEPPSYCSGSGSPTLSECSCSQSPLELSRATYCYVLRVSGASLHLVSSAPWVLFGVVFPGFYQSGLQSLFLFFTSLVILIVQLPSIMNIMPLCDINPLHLSNWSHIPASLL